MGCQHTMIRFGHCLQCGELIFDTEDRSCSECSNFIKKENDWPYCRKHSMTITSDMHATYNVKEGTCFNKDTLINKEDINEI